MGAETNRKNMMRFYEAINRRDLDSVRDIVADGFIDHEIPAELGLPSGWEGAKQYLEMFIAGFPDLKFDPLSIAAEDDIVAARSRLTGTHKGAFMGIEPTGRAIDIEIADFVRVDEDGKAAEHWSFADNLKLMQQLGIVPEQLPGQ